MSVLTPDLRKAFDEALGQLTTQVIAQHAEGLDLFGKPSAARRAAEGRPAKRTASKAAEEAAPARKRVVRKRSS